MDAAGQTAGMATGTRRVDADAPVRWRWISTEAVPFPAPSPVIDRVRVRLREDGVEPTHVARVEVRYVDCADLPGVLDALDAALGFRCLPVSARQAAWLPDAARVEVHAVHTPA